MAKVVRSGSISLVLIYVIIPALAAPKDESTIIGGVSAKTTTDLKAEASERYFSSLGSYNNRPAPVYGPPGYSSGWVGYNGNGYSGYNQGIGGYSGGYNQGFGGYNNGVRGFADGYNSGLGGGYPNYDGGFYGSPGYSSIGLNKWGNGGYGGYGGNGGLSTYSGYNNPAYLGNNNLGYGYYKNSLDGGYNGGGYYAGKGGLGISGITPSYVTGFRGYT